MSKRKSTKGPSAFVAEAYSAESPDELKGFYRKWAEGYDEQMAALSYASPRLVAELLRRHLDDFGAAVLDLGCGTGLTAQCLHDAGYTSLHGIDVSAEMVEQSRRRGIYVRLQTADLNEPLDYDDQSFDAAISSGTFTHGHVGPEPLDEVFRVLKPGGLLACTVHNDLWRSRGFEQKFRQMEQGGLIRCVSRQQDRFYDGGEAEGWFCLYERTVR